MIFPNADDKRVDEDKRVGGAAYTKSDPATPENRVFHIYPGKLKDKDGKWWYVHKEDREGKTYKYSCAYYGTLSNKPVKGLSIENADEKPPDKVAILQAQVETLTKDKTRLQAQVDTLINSMLINDKTRLQAQVDMLIKDKTGLQAQVDRLTTEKTHLQTQVNTLTTEKTNLQTQVNRLQAVVDKFEKAKDIYPDDGDNKDNSAAE